jgi:hypothetical protein
MLTDTYFEQLILLLAFAIMLAPVALILYSRLLRTWQKGDTKDKI